VNPTTLKASYSPPASCKVYTPFSVAEAVIKATRPKPALSWLEPSAGRGAFLAALHGIGVSSDRITAIDLDPVPQRADRWANFHRGIDFLKWSGITTQRFDRIVGNPPYVPLDGLPRDERERITASSGLRGTGNLWAAFVVCSLKLLRAEGAFGMVLPAACEYANYAEPLRARLRNSFEALHVCRCSRPIFPDVEEGAVILIGLRYGKPNRLVARHECVDIRTLVESLSQIKNTKQRSRSKIPLQGTVGCHTVPFGALATVRIGAVTGDAGYFLMNESRRAELGLPRRATIPVVSKAQHLFVAELTEKRFFRLSKNGERVWLFRPLSRDVGHPRVQRYLNLKPAKRGCRKGRYKIKIRNLWYKTPLPRRPHAFVSGMSDLGPWLCFNKTPGVSATNTLYTVRFRSCLTASQRVAVALALLTSSAQSQIANKKRRYAGGLSKVEPCDLAQIRIPPPTQANGAIDTYRRAVRFLVEGDRKRATKLADDFFLRRGKAKVFSRAQVHADR
jgi:adenine-specific DNA-methyltransferase